MACCTARLPLIAGALLLASSLPSLAGAASTSPSSSAQGPLLHLASSLPSFAGAASTSPSSSAPLRFEGRFFSGSGSGDAEDWLTLLETARAQMQPNPLLQDITMLYHTTWQGWVEGPTWGAWWTQNSYGTTYTALPFFPEPHRTFTRNANWMWFLWEGNGTIVGLDDPHPAPDGCLCDAAEPNGAFYKQGDGNVPIHDWALEETLSGVIMQAEQILIERSYGRNDLAVYLPLFNRTLTLIESRRNATNNLFFAGDASNLLAPSYGAWLLPNGTRVPAYLTGMSVSYVAALDRVIELEKLAGGVWTVNAAMHDAQRTATIAGLSALLAPTGDYFVKWADPNGTLHGVLGQEEHGYIEAVSNHDAVCFGVAERVKTGLNSLIMDRLTGPTVPSNPVNGGPGLFPYGLVLTNAGSLDDMEYPAASSWLWNFGTWVNGGNWATCDARMMMAYYRTNKQSLALATMQAEMGFASIFRMDSPLVAFGSAVYQPDEPINIVYDAFGVSSALIRGVWDPVYSADELIITPHLPGNITALSTLFPFVWGPHNFYFSSSGAQGSSSPITAVSVNGQAWATFTATSVTFPWSSLPADPTNFTVVITFGSGATAESAEKEETMTAARRPLVQQPSRSHAPLHPSSHAAAVRAMRALLPSSPAFWLEADKLALSDGAPVTSWPDSSGSGASAATQSSSALQPVFGKTAMAGNPGVVFNGASSFLQGNVTLPSEFTVTAVFQDNGETNVCCTGIFFAVESCGGIGTKVGGSAGTTAIMIDWSGSGDTGADDITGLQVVSTVLYNSSGAYSWADGCLESTEQGVTLPSSGSSTFMVGSRGNIQDRFFNGTLSELIIYPRALNTTERDAVEAYLTTKWPRKSGAKVLDCLPPPPNCTLPQPLVAIDARLQTFVGLMRVGGFADGRYELAHALLALDSVATWGERCAGLTNGTITPLASRGSEQAADALYVSTATNLANGLATVLDGYATSSDPTLLKIYGIWQQSA